MSALDSRLEDLDHALNGKFGITTFIISFIPERITKRIL
jgi:hypothetical protein